MNAHRLASVADVERKTLAQEKMTTVMYQTLRRLTEAQVEYGRHNWPTTWPTRLFDESDAWTADKIVEAVKHGLPHLPNPSVINKLCGIPVPKPAQCVVCGEVVPLDEHGFCRGCFDVAVSPPKH